MDITKYKFVCPTCGREYTNPAQQSIKRYKKDDVLELYIICTTDHSFAFPKPIVEPEPEPQIAVIGKAIINEAIIGKGDGK